MVEAMETSSPSDDGPNLEASELKLRIVPPSERKPPFERPRSCMSSGTGCAFRERMYLTAKTANRAKLKTDRTTATIVPAVERPEPEPDLTALEAPKGASAVKLEAIAARFGDLKTCPIQ